MNELYILAAGLYVLSAKLARCCAFLVGFAGLGYGTLALLTNQDFGGFKALQLYLIGLVGPAVLFAASVALDAVGHVMSRSVSE
jgi:hypothetical protein